MFYANMEFEKVDGDPRFVEVILDDHYDSNLETLMFRVALSTETMDDRYDTGYIKREETILMVDNHTDAFNEVKSQIEKLSNAGYTPRNLYSSD